MSLIPFISVVIPTLNEEETVSSSVESALGEPGVEVIVADGGSRDGTREAASRAGAEVIPAPPGRGRQMNAGAGAARGGVFLFLHADTRLPEGYGRHVRRIMEGEGTPVGAFLLGIEGPGRVLRLIEAAANWRSRRWGLPYGDQAIFMRRETFRGLEGFPEIPIMEDLVMVRRARRLGRVAMAPSAVATSDRRWRSLGAWRVTLLNQFLLLAYFLGVPPERLVRWYYL